MDLIIHMLLLGLVILAVARGVPGIHIVGYGTAIWVAVIYSLIDVLLGTVLKFLGLPFIFITLGLFLLVINTFLLWLTEQLIEDFEIEDLTTTFMAAVLITLGNLVIGWFY